MKRFMKSLIGIGVALGLTGLAAAEPIMTGVGINAASTPNPRVVERCSGPPGPTMVWHKGSLILPALPAEVAVPVSRQEPKREAPRVTPTPPSRAGLGTPGSPGASRPASAAAAADRSWCAGGYREDGGTNFGGS